MTGQNTPLESTPADNQRHRIDLPHARAIVDAAGITTLTITNAKSANILGTPVIADLTNALAELAARDDVRVLVLRGTGDTAFVAGATSTRWQAWTSRRPRPSSTDSADSARPFACSPSP
jgi:enoyl-CoA hydratase/carnithine racemase